MRTTEELIEALRSKESRDNRQLLDEAADRLEELSKKESAGEQEAES